MEDIKGIDDKYLTRLKVHKGAYPLDEYGYFRLDSYPYDRCYYYWNGLIVGFDNLRFLLSLETSRTQECLEKEIKQITNELGDK